MALLAVFLPIKAAILTAFVLVLCDLIVGVLAARKRGESITSGGFRRTIIKLAVYEFAIMFAFLAERYLTGDLVPISKIVTTFIGVTETQSCIENLNEVSGGSLLKTLVTKIGKLEQ